MSGFDVVLDKAFSKPELRSAIALSTGHRFSTEKFMIVDEMPNEECPEEIECIVVVNTVNGQFKLILELYFDDDFVVDLFPGDIVKGLAEELGCNILFSDDEINPYTMNYMNSHGDTSKVFLNVEALDQDKYVIDKNF